MRIYAFEGITYAPSAASDRGALAAPPYDQIDGRRAEELHERHPHHFTWLTRPVEGESGDIYREATRLHRAWLDGGVLRRDPGPALYPYSIELPDGGRRLGVTAMVGLEPPETGIVRPHEGTLAKPLADRLALLEAMEVDLEPVLLLSEDGGALDTLLAEDVAGEQPLVTHTDEAGNRHRVFRLGDRERIGRYRECLGPVPAAIADGHHRYKVGLRYARERGLLDDGEASGPPPAAAPKLAVVTSLRSPALEIQPIHRALAEDPGFTGPSEVAPSRRPAEVAGGGELAAAVAAAPQPALGVLLRGGGPEIWRLDPATGAAAGVPDGARELPVALLHGALLPALGVPEEAATDGTVAYRSDPDALWEMVRTGEAAVGIWLPPMEPGAFAAAIAGGRMLPPKSTRFVPKVVSGTVWADHGAALG